MSSAFDSLPWNEARSWSWTFTEYSDGSPRSGLSILVKLIDEEHGGSLVDQGYRYSTSPDKRFLTKKRFWKGSQVDHETTEKVLHQLAKYLLHYGWEDHSSIRLDYIREKLPHLTGSQRAGCDTRLQRIIKQMRRGSS